MHRSALSFLPLLFLVFLASAKIEQSKYAHSTKSKDINFTFYHNYEYPKSDCLQVAILINEKGKTLSELVQKIINTTQALKTVALLHNSTFVDNSPVQNNSVNIIWDENFQIQKRVSIKVEGPKRLALMLDKIHQLRSQHRFFIDLVMEGHSEPVNYQNEDDKAKLQISLKSSTICQIYFGMKLQEIVYIQKINQQQSNQSQHQLPQNSPQSDQSEHNQTHYFEGNLEEIADQIAKIDYQQNYEWENAVYKCQIICKTAHGIPVASFTQSKTKQPKVPSTKQSKAKASKIQKIKKKHQNLEL